VKKGLLTEHDQIILWGLQEQALGGRTDLLPRLARDSCLGAPLPKVPQELRHSVIGFHKPHLITLRFVSGCPKRHGLRLADRRGIDDPKADEHRVPTLRPANAKFQGACAVHRTI
jgi:hypothetical protein